MASTKGIIGILTGGGDVPGLNPAIRAITLRALGEGYKVIGLRRKSRADSVERASVYREGIATPVTFAAPSASAAITAATDESIPPDNPITARRIPFFRAKSRTPSTSARKSSPISSL